MSVWKRTNTFANNSSNVNFDWRFVKINTCVEESSRYASWYPHITRKMITLYTLILISESTISTGRPSSLFDRDKRAILRVASNSQLTTKQIMKKSSVSASVSSVRRVLLSCKDIKRLKLKKKPSLTTKHRAERLRFAKERMHWKKKWRRIVISDEKDSTWMVLVG